MRSLFSEEDAHNILNIRIPQHQCRDRLSWVNSRDGHYTVKSGYQAWQERANQQGYNDNSRGWKRLWKLQVPSKVKFFIWQFCKNNVHVRDVLQGRCNAISIVCPMCNNDAGHLLHVFFECNFASNCWDKLGMPLDMRGVEDVSGWLLDKLASKNYTQLKSMVMTLWGIWFFRNKKVWERKTVSPQLVVDWSLHQLHEWKVANAKVIASQSNGVNMNGSRANRVDTRWIKPGQGKLKLNVGASIVQGNSFFSVGMVLRDQSGDFLGGQVLKYGRAVSVLEAEAIGIEEALSWIITRGVQEVCIESDSLLAVQAINGGGNYQLEVGHCIETCKLILAAISDITVSYVRRLANRAAHPMARIPCELNQRVSIMIPPRSVLDSVMYDASS